jgi:heme exporter protein D
MPDLGKYAATVLGAYGVTILLLLGLVALTWVQSRRARARLEEAERQARVSRGGEQG